WGRAQIAGGTSNAPRTELTIAVKSPLLSAGIGRRFGRLPSQPTSHRGVGHMTWTQNYAPLGSILLSALVAALPVIVLLGSLAFFHIKAHIAALLGLAAALLVAIVVYGMPPGMALAAGAN